MRRALTSYTKGMCGEKRFKLDDTTPSFLSIAYDLTDPVLNAATLTFDHTKATTADVKIYTISYKVESV